MIKEDMPHWRAFVEEITGRPYNSPNREPPQKKKKTKTTMNRREGSEPNQRKQKQDNV